IALTAFAEPSIPILTAAISRSRVNSPRVSVTVSGSTVCTLLTPSVDWTVKAVMQATPQQPWAAIVLMSAVTPAHDEGSNPATVSTMGGASAMLAIYQNRALLKIPFPLPEATLGFR